MVPAIDAKSAYVDRPVLPDRYRIAVDLLDIIPERPEAEHWTADFPARVPISLIMNMVDANAGTVVLDHPMDGFGPMDGLVNVSVGRLAHEVWRELIVPCVGIGRDYALGLIRLREEEPVVPVSSKLPVGSLKMFEDW